jgi:hypothetical protein
MFRLQRMSGVPLRVCLQTPVLVLLFSLIPPCSSLCKPRQGPGAVNFGKQKVLPVAVSSTICFELVIPSNQRVHVQLHDVLYVPEFEAGSGLSILSVFTVHKHGHGVNLDHAPGFVRWHHTGTNLQQICDWQEQGGSTLNPFCM